MFRYLRFTLNIMMFIPIILFVKPSFIIHNLSHDSLARFFCCSFALSGCFRCLLPLWLCFPLQVNTCLDNWVIFLLKFDKIRCKKMKISRASITSLCFCLIFLGFNAFQINKTNQSSGCVHNVFTIHINKTIYLYILHMHTYRHAWALSYYKDIRNWISWL